MGVTMNPDGSVSVDQSGWDRFIHGENTEEQMWALEFNNANKQYAQQYQLQKEAQAANLQNMQFNQNLANRQQALSEESYYNGVTNEARQLASLGINPASSGQSLSGGTMSGGSNVSGVSTPSASGRNPNSYNVRAKAQQQLQTLSVLAALSKQRSDIQLQDAQAEAVLQNADTQSKLADSRIGLESQEFRNNDEAYQAFADLGLSYGLVRALENVDLSTLGLTGLYKILTVFGSKSDSKSDSRSDSGTFGSGEPKIYGDITSAILDLNPVTRSNLLSYINDNIDSPLFEKMSVSDLLKHIKSLDDDMSRRDIAMSFVPYF